MAADPQPPGPDAEREVDMDVRRGAPNNPNERGYHWIAGRPPVIGKDHGFPLFWRDGEWVIHLSAVKPTEMYGLGWTRYLGPCLPPGDIATLTTRAERAETERDAAQEREAGLRALLNNPHNSDWLEGVRVEAPHQQLRYSPEHDASRTPWDWFWLIGYLAQKAAAAAVMGDLDKAKHHTISTGAALLNWHRHLAGLGGNGLHG